MIPDVPPRDPRAASQRVLVVDDDRRVRELLEVALSAHGFGVLTASDGEEAIKRAVAERPDLIVLDMRLPKRSGLEVCDALRNDPHDPSVPIILVSAAAEVDARLHAFSRGADDYLSKPFSPKELIARIRRMLSRAAESRAAIQRARELERELARAQDEARRAHAESTRVQRLRELALGLGRELLRTADGDVLARRLLLTLQSRLAVPVVALLMREKPDGPLLPCAVVGDGFERIAGLEIDPAADLAALLASRGRPALRAELERLPGLSAGCAPFVRARFDVIAPVRGGDGLDALVLLGERHDGTALSLADAELLGGLCEIAAVLLRSGARMRVQSNLLLELLTRATAGDTTAAARAEAAALTRRAARNLGLHPRQRELLGHAVALAARASWTEERATLERLRALDLTGRAEDLARLLERALEPALPGSETDEAGTAAVLLRAGLDYAAARALGLPPEESLAAAIERAGAALDEAARDALQEAAREGEFSEGHAA